MKTAVWDIHPSLSGLPSPDREQRLLLALQCYIDDSGKDDPPVFVLAGYVARAETWASFSDVWKAKLAEPPSLAYFKMQEAFTLAGEFAGWSGADRDRKLAALAEIVRDHAMAGIAATVNHAEYAAAMKGRVSQFMDRPYGLMFFLVMISAFEWQTAVGLSEPIRFIFDTQDYDADHVDYMFTKAMEISTPDIRERFGQRPVHMDDKEAVPLQAADLLAWHIRRWNFDSKGLEQSAALPAMKPVPLHTLEFGRERLANFVRLVSEENTARGQLTPYQVDAMFEQADALITIWNLKEINRANPQWIFDLQPIPSSKMKRYLLVNRCPSSDSPHLHRRAGNVCLSRAAGVQAARDRQARKE